MGILSLLCVIFVCLFVCTVTDFSAAEKMGVEFRMRFRLLSEQVFSHFGGQMSKVKLIIIIIIIIIYLP